MGCLDKLEACSINGPISMQKGQHKEIALRKSWTILLAVPFGEKLWFH